MPPVRARNQGAPAGTVRHLPRRKNPESPLRIASLAGVWRWDPGAGWALAPSSQLLGAGGELGEKEKTKPQKPNQNQTHFSTAGGTAA